MWKLQFVFQGSQKRHVRVAISQKGLLNFFRYAHQIEAFFTPVHTQVSLFMGTPWVDNSENYPSVGTQVLRDVSLSYRRLVTPLHTHYGTKCHGWSRDPGKNPSVCASPQAAWGALGAGIFARSPRAAWHFDIITLEFRFQGRHCDLA